MPENFETIREGDSDERNSKVENVIKSCFSSDNSYDKQPIRLAYIFKQEMGGEPTDKDYEKAAEITEKECLDKLDVFNSVQVILRGEAVTQGNSIIDNPKLFEGRVTSGVRSTIDTSVDKEDVLLGFLEQIQKRCNFAYAYESENDKKGKWSRPVVLFGLRKGNNIEQNHDKYDKHFFWGETDDVGSSFSNVGVIAIPDERDEFMPNKRSPLSEKILNLRDNDYLYDTIYANAVYSNKETYFKLLLIANHILSEMVQFDAKSADAKNKNESLRKQERSISESYEKIISKKYKVLTPDTDNSIVKVIDQIRYWHDEFKPDYVFLTETTAVPIGYVFKAAWETAYPNEELPKFFRVDPKAMGHRSNAKDFSGYEKKLEDFLSKRIDKENPKIAIFDEQPVSRTSQKTVRTELARSLNINLNNIEISLWGTAIGGDEFVSGDLRGLKLTTKETPSYQGKEYESEENLKFTGKIRHPRSGYLVGEKVLDSRRKRNVVYSEGTGRFHKVKKVNLLKVISDLKLLGKKSGITMVKLQAEDPIKYRKESEKYIAARRLWEEADKKRNKTE